MGNSIHHEMHYSYAFTFILAMVVTFLIGIFIVEVLFKTGLDYFASIKSNITVHQPAIEEQLRQ